MVGSGVPACLQAGQPAGLRSKPSGPGSASRPT